MDRAVCEHGFHVQGNDPCTYLYTGAKCLHVLVPCAQVEQRKISADIDSCAHGTVRRRFSAIYFDIWYVLPLGGWDTDTDVLDLPPVGIAAASGNNERGTCLFPAWNFWIVYLLSVFYRDHRGIAFAGDRHLDKKARTQSYQKDKMEDGRDRSGGRTDRNPFCKAAFGDNIGNF